MKKKNPVKTGLHKHGGIFFLYDKRVNGKFLNHEYQNPKPMHIHSTASRRIIISRLWSGAIVLLLTIIHFPSLAQKELIDSLKNRIAVEKNDTVKVRMYFRIGVRARLSDTTESWHSHSEILKLAEKNDNKYFRGSAYLLAATIRLESNRLKASSDFEKAIKTLTPLVESQRAQSMLGTAYMNFGLMHYNSGDYETAISYYLKTEDVFLKYDPKNADMGLLYSNLSIAYGAVNKYDAGLVYSKKGLDWARKSKDMVTRLQALYAYGGNLVNAKKGDQGLVFLDSTRQLAIQLNLVDYVYFSSFMKAMYYYNTKQYEEAIRYYTECQDLARKHNWLGEVGTNYVNISACEAELKRPRQAAAHLDSSTKYIDYSLLSSTKQMYFENYAEVYKQLGNFTKAFAFKDSVGVIRDSLYQADNVKQLVFRQARYNYEKRQNEIDQLEIERLLQDAEIRQKNIFNYLLIGGTCALLIILFLSFRTYRQKQNLQAQRISELETEKKLAATEAVLKGEEQERARMAKDLHDGLGGMLSGIKYALNSVKGNLIMTPENAQAFERSIDMLDGSIREMRRVAHNMMPEALMKFGLDIALKDYCNDIIQSGALKINYQSIGLENTVLDQTVAINIYRVIQELAGNILKHAQAKTAIVQISKMNDLLSVTVEDDGKGFDVTSLHQVKGIGWSNIQNRVKFLKGKIDINSEPGKGTSVLIELPV